MKTEDQFALPGIQDADVRPQCLSSIARSMESFSAGVVQEVVEKPFVDVNECIEH